MNNVALAHVKNLIPDGYLNEYVTNIPWESNPAFVFSDDVDGYLTAFKNVVQIIPTRDMKINFTDDVWDFNPYFKRINSSTYKFNFSNCPDEIKDYEKFFVLHGIMGTKSISTVHLRYTASKRIISNIMKEKKASVFSITTDDIYIEINRRHLSPSTESSEFTAAYQFFKFLKNNYRLPLPVNIESLWEASDKARRRVSKEESKYPNIPDEYYHRIRNAAIMVMRDETVEYQERATACMIVIMGETGLRVGDLMALTTSGLQPKTLSTTGNTIHYIHYSSEKPSRAHQEMLEFNTLCTSTCAEAYEILKDIRNNCKYASQTDFLYILNPTRASKDDFPIRKGRFLARYRNFVVKYLPDEASREWGEFIAPSKYKGKTVYIPKTPQFRVYVCSYLYNVCHVSLIWIQRFMGHLSETMMGYYVRSKDTYQEDYKYFGKIIKEIHQEHLTLLGGDGNGKEIAKRIKEFLTDNKINVASTIEEIANTVKDRIVIRAKTGGVCIKTSLMSCAQDARTNEIMCAHDLCPNLFHFYYMADVSYVNFITLQETFNANIKKGHIKAAQKELNKLKTYLRQRLIPELDEMDKEIGKSGINYIIERYPTLIDIIENETNIREEISVWMEKKIQG